MSNHKCVSWRERRWARIELVKNYLTSLSDERLILLAFLMSRGFTRERIMRTLNISSGEYNTLKDRLAMGLIVSGLIIRN